MTKVPSGNATLSGALVRHPKGSNGGVHRGPDKFPRANALRAVVLMTLAAPGHDLKDLPNTLRELQVRRRRHHKRLIPAAAAHLMVEANLTIITRAAMGDDTVYGRFLTLQRDFHRIMAGGDSRNTNDGTADRRPFPSSFIAEPAADAAQAPVAPGALVVDSQEYLAGRPAPCDDSGCARPRPQRSAPDSEGAGGFGTTVATCAVPGDRLEALAVRVKLHRLEWRVMALVLSSPDPVTASKLARRLRLDYGLVKRIVRELVRWKVLERIRAGLRFQPDHTAWGPPR